MLSHSHIYLPINPIQKPNNSFRSIDSTTFLCVSRWRKVTDIRTTNEITFSNSHSLLVTMYSCYDYTFNLTNSCSNICVDFSSTFQIHPVSTALVTSLLHASCTFPSCNQVSYIHLHDYIFLLLHAHNTCPC